MENGTKTCSVCGVEKSLEAFHLERLGKHGRRASCRECVNARKREWHRQSWEAEAAYKREWRQRNRDRLREADRAWRAANPVRVRELAQQGRALRQKTPIDREYEATLRRDPCAYCGVSGTETDHIVSVIAGGEPGWTNMTASCHGCNSSKRALPMLLFLKRRIPSTD